MSGIGSYPSKDWQEVALLSYEDFEIATHLFLMDVKKAEIVFVDKRSLLKFAAH